MPLQIPQLVITLLIAGILAGPTAVAEESVPPEVAAALADLIPGSSPNSIRRSAIPDLYEVVFGPHVVYVTGDGHYMMRGDLIDLSNKTNLTEEKRRLARVSAIEDLGESSMIVFAPENPKHTVTVFTDVECPYCAKLHRTVPELNRRGVKVRYLAFPRTGIPSRSYDTMVSVWCSNDPQQAMSDAKFGEHVAPKKCTNPIKQHFALGQLVGVEGTPTIVLDSGQVLPGYVPPQRLLQELGDGSG